MELRAKERKIYGKKESYEKGTKIDHVTFYATRNQSLQPCVDGFCFKPSGKSRKSDNLHYNCITKGCNVRLILYIDQSGKILNCFKICF